MADKMGMSLDAVIEKHWTPSSSKPSGGTGAGRGRGSAPRAKGAGRGRGKAKGRGKARNKGKGKGGDSYYPPRRNPNLWTGSGSARAAQSGPRYTKRSVQGKGGVRGWGKGAGKRTFRGTGVLGVNRAGGIMKPVRQLRALKGGGKGRVKGKGRELYKGKGKGMWRGAKGGRDLDYVRPQVRKLAARFALRSRGKGIGRRSPLAIKDGSLGRGRLASRIQRGVPLKRSQTKGGKGSRKGAKGIGKQRRKGKGGGKGASMMALGNIDADWEHDMFDYGDDDFSGSGDAWSKARGAQKGRGKGGGKSRSKGKRSKGQGRSYYDEPEFLDRDARGSAFDDRSPPDRKLSQDDLNMMKKITIVAQLDKVPKPPSAMQGMTLGKSRRENEGSLSRRFAGLDG